MTTGLLPLTTPSGLSGAALVLLLLCALSPLLDRPLRRVVIDPVVTVAATSAGLLGLAAVATALDEGGVGSGSWGPGVAVVLGLLTSVAAGSHVVRGLFRLTRGEVVPRPVPDARTGRRAGQHHPHDGTDDSADDLLLEAPGSVLRGGAWIGYLERAAVTGSLLAGFPEGLALVLAIKGVGRYPELRDSGSARGNADAPEEFIIGTLTSLLWASACAGVAQLVR